MKPLRGGLRRTSGWPFEASGNVVKRGFPAQERAFESNMRNELD
jgi:hypothetical protein